MDLSHLIVYILLQLLLFAFFFLHIWLQGQLLQEIQHKRGGFASILWHVEQVNAPLLEPINPPLIQQAQEDVVPLCNSSFVVKVVVIIVVCSGRFPIVEVDVSLLILLQTCTSS